MGVLRNRKLRQLGKAAVSAALLYMLLRAVSWESLVATLAQARLGWFLLAFAASIGTLVLSAWRWRFVLKSLGVEPPQLSTLVYYYFVSSFFNNFAPANLAGDAVRVNSLFRSGHDGVAATGSIILERVLNLVGIAALCIWVLLARPLPLAIAAPDRIIWVLVVLLVCSGAAGLWLWWRPPQRLRARLDRLYQLLKSLRSHGGQLGWACLVTVGLMFVMVLIMVGSLQALGVYLPLSVHLAVYAIAGLVLTLPVTIQGIGVREGIYVGLLGLIGVEPARVLTALALTYVITLLLSVLGGLLFWIGPRPTSPQIAA